MKRFSIILILLLSVSLGFAKGAIVAWGHNSCGCASPSNKVLSHIPPGENFVDIATGTEFAMALDEDGKIYVWGDKYYLKQNAPKDGGYISIAGGKKLAAAVDSQGRVVWWDDAFTLFTSYHILTNRTGYVQVAVSKKAVVSNHKYIYALHADGTVDRMFNYGYQLPTGYTYSAISAGEDFIIGLTTGGEIKFAGPYNHTAKNPPAGSNFVEISAGPKHGVARKADGTIVIWGDKMDKYYPNPNNSFTHIAASNQGGAGLKGNGTVKAWGKVASMNNVPNGIQSLDLVKLAGGDMFYVGLTEILQDRDGDGILDVVDEFPDDAERAFTQLYPIESPDGWGTLAFEDLWPDQGDYDFNDFVIDYKLELTLNADNLIKDIEGEFSLRAVGALKKNGFAIEFPFAASELQGDVRVVRNGAESFEGLTVAGSKSVLNLVANTTQYVTVTGSDNLWNTQADKEKHDPIPFSFKLTLREPIDQLSLPEYGFWNPFLMVDVDYIVGKEIHLPGYPPTALADDRYFQTGADDTDPEIGKYYKTAANLPWAIDVPMSWKYPQEHKQISDVYFGFGPWAQSGGVSNTDWYIPKSGEHDPSKLYNK